MATRTGVSVFTWGSENYSSDPMEYDTGMSHFAKTQLLGGNVGHASILLALPDTQENRELVAAHLEGTGIPVETKKYETKQVEFVDGKPVKTDKNAYEESVIEVYFSWWPNLETNGFSFNSFSADCIAERSGVDTHFSPQWKQYLDPDVRRASAGVLSALTNSTITLQSANIVHERGYTEDELNILHTAQYNQFNNNLYETACRVFNNLDKLVRSDRLSQPLSMTNQIMLRKIFPERELDLTDLKKLRAQVLTRTNEISNLVNISTFDYVRALAKLNTTESDLTDSEKEMFSRIQNIRLLSKSLNVGEFARLNNYEKNQINGLLATAYPEQFPHGVTSDNFTDLVKLVKKDCDPAIEGGLANLNKDIIAKGDRQILNECIQGIDNSRELLAAINAYENASDENKEEAKQVMLVCLAKIPTLNETYNNESSPYNDDYLAVLKSRVESLVTPSRNGHYYKTLKDVMNYPGNDFTQSLLTDRTKIVLQEGMVEGHRPNHKVDIPLQESSENGLDPEAMLQQMALFANQGRGFNLVNNNCSVTSSAILARGAKEHGWVFEQGAFGNSIANPQMVYNNAMQFSSTKREALVPPATGWFTSTQNYLAGLSIHHTAEATKPEASHMSRIGNTLGALSSGIFASAMMLVNAFGASSEAHFEDLAPLPRKAQQGANPLQLDTSVDHTSVAIDDTARSSSGAAKDNNPLHLSGPITWSYQHQEHDVSTAVSHPKSPAVEIDNDQADKATPRKIR